MDLSFDDLEKMNFTNHGNTLLHIPHGSEHSIKVETGKHMHYLWLDFFQDLESVSYIDHAHLPDRE